MRKVAIITEATQDTGAMHARRLVEEGAKVAAITDTNLEAAQQLANAIGENVIALKLDIANTDNWKTVIQKTEEKFGPITMISK